MIKISTSPVSDRHSIPTYIAFRYQGTEGRSLFQHNYQYTLRGGDTCRAIHLTGLPDLTGPTVMLGSTVGDKAHSDQIKQWQQRRFFDVGRRVRVSGVNNFTNICRDSLSLLGPQSAAVGTYSEVAMFGYVPGTIIGGGLSWVEGPEGHIDVDPDTWDQLFVVPD